MNSLYRTLTGLFFVCLFASSAQTAGNGELSAAAKKRAEHHWAFKAPQPSNLPPVKNQDWIRNEIDRYVLARLESMGLRPSGEANRSTLIRRLSFDLTGLPPTPKEVKDFLADQSPNAYEKVVDRLLASRAYGERWARVWLDLARYADTNGYEKDAPRTVWPYRDWVIKAFNDDMPFDQFSVEQLAGDLLPNPTEQQLLATVFHRNTMTNTEGGTSDEEYRVEAVKDRIDITSQIWMGLTAGCAKCHDHKYDPVSQTEYYQLYAFFDQTADSDKANNAPVRKLPSPYHLQNRPDPGELDRLEKALTTPNQQTRTEQAAWEKEHVNWLALEPKTMKAASTSKMELQDDSSILVSGPVPKFETYTLQYPLSGERIAAVRIEALPHPSLPKGGPGRAINDGNFVLTGVSAKLTMNGKTIPVTFKEAIADFSQRKYPIAHAVNSPNPRKNGWGIAPQMGKEHQAVFILDQPIDLSGEASLEIIIDHQFDYRFPGFSIGRFRISTSASPSPGLLQSLPADIRKILAETPAKRSDDEQVRLAAYYASISMAHQTIRTKLEDVKAQTNKINPPQVPIMQELAANQKRVTRFLHKGNFLEPGDEVGMKVPGALHPMPKDAPLNRLGLSKWLLDKNNPLTARVTVNRYWARIFGTGLVETEEDFGTQGSLPSHPGLLDWLALEFQNDLNWSMKKLCRTIVLSATYRQTARVTSDRLEKDPDNRYLSRGPRFRLDAEMIRDQALALSGLLSRKMYGPSVMPHQPDGIWKVVYSGQRWTISQGEDRYRRGLYTYLRRTSPYPSFLLFDTGSGETCLIRRIRTNTPTAALVTLNDPVYTEAAQALARRILKEGGTSLEERISYAWFLTTSRKATPAEIDHLVARLKTEISHFTENPPMAKDMATIPLGPLPSNIDQAEAAAWTVLSGILLNLDEVLTKG